MEEEGRVSYTTKRQRISTIETTSPTRGLLAAGLQGSGPQGYCTLRNGAPLRDMPHLHHPLVSACPRDHREDVDIREMLNYTKSVSGWRDVVYLRILYDTSKSLGWTVPVPAKVDTCHRSLRCTNPNQIEQGSEV